MKSPDHTFTVVPGPVDHEETFVFTHEGTRQYIRILDAEMANARTLQEANDLYQTALSIAKEAFSESDGDRYKLQQYALMRLRLWKENIRRNYASAMQDPSVN